MSMCRVFSCVVESGYLLSPVHSLGRTLLVFALLHSSLQGQTCLLLQVFLHTFAYQSPIMKRRYFLDVNSRRSCRSSKLFNFSFFIILGWVTDLDYCDIQWFTLEMNRDHSVVFEIASTYCISDSFVDYDGDSISSKGFLPIVVDTLVMWIKFTHSSPFSLIPKMSTFTLAISYLITTNLP